MKRSKVILVMLWLLLPGLQLVAQSSFRYKAALLSPDSSAFYSIPLTQMVVAKCKKGYPDVRIFDQDGKVVSYLRKEQLPPGFRGGVVPLQPVNQPGISDTLTGFIVENKTKLPVRSVYVRLRNAAVSRTAELAGSDDLKTWYAISDTVVLKEAITGNNTYHDQKLDFPPVNYRYLKVRIKDSRKFPLAILSVYNNDKQPESILYEELRGTAFKQKDSLKKTIISLILGDNYQVNRLNLHVTSPKFFNRTVRVFDVQNREKLLLADTVINADHQRLFLNTQTRHLLLEIDNEDNPPLTITDISAFQQAEAVYAYLEKSKQYSLYFGDPKAEVPSYDLQLFASRLPAILPEIFAQPYEKNPLYALPHRSVAIVPSWAVWVAIGISLITLLLLTFKISMAVKKLTEEERAA